ncbi:hypothetical protein UlMin_016264 [Ulmus minor]
MAGVLVGGALLSGVINVFLERLAPQDVILKLFRGNKDVVKMLDELKVKLLSVNMVLNDAEEKQLTSPDVKKWLLELTHVIYRADFLMDKIDTEASQREREDVPATTTSKIVNFFSTSVAAFEKSVLDEGKEILDRLNLLLDQKVHLGLKEGDPTRSLKRLDAPLVAKESDVVGRDGDKEEIVKLLLSDDASGNNLSVIPIVGMGGVGKTTIAQLVIYKDSRVQQHFDSKVWVTISEEFDVFQITKRIYKEVTSRECETGELLVLQRKLNESLAGKRFLFVLDDVWNENYGRWESLKSGFQSGADGSRIIVTTRSKDVASTMSKGVMHELKLVSDEDCWLLFEKHAFHDNQAPTEELKTIGRKIVERCKGLPLAVKSVAGLLRTTSNAKEWEKVLNSDVWLKKDIVPALWLSYHFLPPVLKRCFAYCSIFPKDYEFGKSDMEKIIWLWMAEGLLTPEDVERMEDVGKAYLQALTSRSFFQPSSTKKSVMVMHDLVHDLAMFISGEFCFSCGDSNDLSNLGTKSCHHLSYRKGKEMKLGAVSQSREKKLRTLLALPLSSEYVRYKPILELHELFLKVGGCLRVLSLSQSSITELPDSIGNMKYLRYLDLSHTKIKELPDSICTFYNLQTLLLSFCQDLERLPTRLADLVNLRHLDIRETRVKEMPPQMCKMKSLQTLSDFVLGENDSWRIKELGEFPLLEGRLRISGLEYIVDVKDVLEANLKDKKFLSELILEWGSDSNITSSQQEREVLEALQPHTNLKKLKITGYRGTIFPDWVGHESFCNMVQVDLLLCGNVCMLPPLGQLSSLRRLLIGGLDGVVSIGNEFCGSSSTTTPFTSLEELSIWAMESWEEWSFSSDRLGQEGGVFPSLTKLSISQCPQLIVGLPDCHLPSLKSIDIEDCDEMEGVFVCQSRQEMDTNAFPSLQSISISACNKLIVGLPDCHLPSLKSIEIWYCDEMEGVFVCQSRQEMDTNAFPSLQSLEITGCKKPWENRMKWGMERLPSLMTLSLLEIQEEVDSFLEEGLLPTTLTHLSISSFVKLKGLNGRAFQQLTSLQNLEIWNCGELECLPQEGLPLSLSSLTILGCSEVLQQRCQRGTGEDWPKIQHIPKIRINQW